MTQQLDRREFLGEVLLSTVSGWALTAGQGLRAEETVSASGLHVAPFKFDVTPPLGHSCCGGWIKPIEAVDDSLEAVGIVLLGAGKPIVLCAVDWTGLLNEAHVEWRTVLAQAAGTTPDRVAVHCVHQHNAPFACIEAEKFVLAEGDLPHIVQLDFFKRCLEQARNAVEKAIPKAQAVTHIGWGQGQIEGVASNRRAHRDASGKIIAMRGSACRDPVLIALPDGLIDPLMKTIAFFDNDKKIAACHYYATHPMSYYADGRATSDFAGLARKRRQQDEPNCLHLYFTGCAGNISAGKYNDGSKERRPILTQRVYDGIVASESKLEKLAVKTLAWKTTNVLPPARSNLKSDELQRQISTKNLPVVGRNRLSYQLAWLKRLEKQIPIVLSSLQIGDVKTLHLPAECFIEYQLRAQQIASKCFVATAAYGDGGPWYIPVKEEYPAGGYEVSVAFCEPEVDDVLTAGMQVLLKN